MNAKDLCAIMVDSVTAMDSAMAVYGFLKEELYQYSDMAPGADTFKVSSLNEHMKQLIMAFEGFELAVAKVQGTLRGAVELYKGENNGQ